MDKGSAGACSICGRARAPRSRNPAFPFGSAGCKLVDLGRWLDGAYRVAGAAAIDADELHTPREEGS